MSVIEISCLEVWREISNYLDNEIDADLRSRMEAHFRVCAHCKAILDGTGNVLKLVGDNAEYRVPEGFVRMLSERIADSWRRPALYSRGVVFSQNLVGEETGFLT